MQLSKEEGGRALPCLLDYYKAAQLRSLVCCCNPDYIAKWKDLEISQLAIPLQSLLGRTTLYKQYFNSLNQWTKVPFRIWFIECKSPLLERQSRLLRWVTFDPDFKPTKSDGRFQSWYRLGITTFSSISSKGELDSYQEISDMYCLEKCDLFRYLQTRTYNSEIRYLEKHDPNLVDLFIDVYKNKDNRKLVSKLYLFIQSNKEHSTRKVRLKWEREASLAISEEEWLNICSVQATTSSCMWREFCWKNLIRYFITPKLNLFRMVRRVVVCAGGNVGND